MNNQIELPIPELSSFSGSSNDLIITIGTNIQLLTHAINIIRRDQEVIFKNNIPYLLSRIDELNVKVDSLDKKVNILTVQNNEILAQTLLLAETVKNIQTNCVQTNNFLETNLNKSPTLTVKYYEGEIPDEHLDTLEKDELKKLRQNIYVSVSRYKKSGKDDQIKMCQNNIEKINTRIK